MTKNKFLFLFIIIGIEIILYFFLTYLKDKEAERFNSVYKSYNITQPLNATIGFYKKSAMAIYSLFIDNDDVLSMLSKASKSNDAEIQNQQRKKLWNKLKAEYEIFKKMGIKQLHFHFTDTTSFLRFHKPNKFGDSLTDIRHSLVLANKNRTFIEGFEEGRIFNGYRYVFPLNYKNEHIGTVEVSVGFNALAKILHKDFNVQPYMILKDEVVKEKVFSKERRNYSESFISKYYFHEANTYDNVSKLDFDDDEISQKTFQAILKKYDNRFNSKLEKNQYFQYFDNDSDFSYIITFYPIQNIQGNYIGYIVLMDKNYDYIKIEHEFLYRFIFSSLFFITLLAFIFHLQKLNVELKESEHKAKIATTAKSEFLANMSHEIRTPLNAIFGFINLLKKMRHTPKVEEYLSTILTSSQTLKIIINDILDFSKIESGKFSFELTSFKTKEVFEDLYQMFLAVSHEKNIDFRLHYDGEIEPFIETDVTRIKQVITNLLSNAIKFTPASGKIDLVVSCHDEMLNVKVIDSGVGIPKEQQDSIFLKFEQADNTTTRKYGGTGLGLAISSFIITSLGGELKLESDLGKGSVFYFDLPIKTVDNILEETTTEEIEEKFDGHILLVEDNKTNQMLMKILLEAKGLTVDIANDGLEAIQAYKNRSYDLIFMDENMPNMNGIAATKEILKLDIPKKSIPIIALTADAVNNAKARYLQAGMKDYLSKPLDEKELVRVLKTYLS